jgi:hypothetical protein
MYCFQAVRGNKSSSPSNLSAMAAGVWLRVPSISPIRSNLAGFIFPTKGLDWIQSEEELDREERPSS